MVRRYEVMDEQWKIIEPHLENKAKRTERPQVDNRKGIIFRMTFWYPAVINLRVLRSAYFCGAFAGSRISLWTIPRFSG